LAAAIVMGFLETPSLLRLAPALRENRAPRQRPVTVHPRDIPAENNLGPKMSKFEQPNSTRAPQTPPLNAPSD